MAGATVMKISVADINNVQKSNFKLHRENGRNDYLFVLFKSPAKVMIEDSYVNADLGSFIIFDKHKIQSYYPANTESFIHDYMHFDLDNDNEKYLLSKIPMGKLLYTSSPNTISSVLLEIKNELKNKYAKYNTEILNSLGTVLLCRLIRETETANQFNTSKNYYSELSNLRNDIYKNPQMDWSIENMSQKIHISRSYFQYLYKSFFSISFNQDVINARITYAKILLTTSSLTIYEISEKCGYQSPEHFIRQFKKKLGVSPKNFKNNL